MPKGAVIESWNVVLGGSVSNSTALATIDFPSDLIAEALVTQADISSLKVGQKAALTIDGETSDPFTGTITSIANQPASSSSSGSSSSTVEYTVDLAPHGLPTLARSGMTGSLTVTIASRSNVLLVPTSAVSGTSSASFVRVMQNGTPTYRQVTTGMATSSLTQITSGLPPARSSSPARTATPRPARPAPPPAASAASAASAAAASVAPLRAAPSAARRRGGGQ